MLKVDGGAVHVIPARVQHAAVVEHGRIVFVGVVKGHGAHVAAVALAQRQRVRGTRASCHSDESHRGAWK